MQELSAVEENRRESEESTEGQLQETELGVKLFDRVGRRIKLNKNGKAFVQYAEQAMKLLQEHSATLVSMLHGSHSGEIQVEVPRPQQGEQPWQQPEQQPGQQQRKNRLFQRNTSKNHYFNIRP